MPITGPRLSAYCLGCRTPYVITYRYGITSLPVYATAPLNQDDQERRLSTERWHVAAEAEESEARQRSLAVACSCGTWTTAQAQVQAAPPPITKAKSPGWSDA
jgi:hypothetical protein